MLDFGFPKAIFSALLLPPLNIILVCVVGLVCVRRWPRVGLTLSGCSLILLVLLSTNAGALLFVAPLEQLTIPLASTRNTGAQVIVLLGGENLDDAPEYGGASIPDSTEYARIRYAARLHRETGLPILTTGGGYILERVLYEDFGIKVKWVEDASTNTAENASFTAKMLGQAGVKRILLVTDAMHMPRSKDIFVNNGLEVVPAPTLFFSRDPMKPLHFVPNGEGMRRSNYAFHEWIAIVWYWLRYGS